MVIFIAQQDTNQHTARTALLGGLAMRLACKMKVVSTLHCIWFIVRALRHSMPYRVVWKNPPPGNVKVLECCRVRVPGTTSRRWRNEAGVGTCRPVPYTMI